MILSVLVLAVLVCLFILTYKLRFACVRNVALLPNNVPVLGHSLQFPKSTYRTVLLYLISKISNCMQKTYRFSNLSPKKSSIFESPSDTYIFNGFAVVCQNMRTFKCAESIYVTYWKKPHPSNILRFSLFIRVYIIGTHYKNESKALRVCGIFTMYQRRFS